jgi:hypothetical protein
MNVCAGAPNKKTEKRKMAGHQILWAPEFAGTPPFSTIYIYKNKRLRLAARGTTSAAHTVSFFFLFSCAPPPTFIGNYRYAHVGGVRAQEIKEKRD